MSFENTPQVQAPQIQNTAEPVSTVPTVNLPHLNLSQDPPLLALLTDFIMTAGEKAAGLAVAAVSKATDVVANGVERISNYASSLSHAMPQDLPMGKSVESQSIGQQRSPERSPSMEPDLEHGRLTPGPTPGFGLAANQGQSWHR